MLSGIQSAPELHRVTLLEIIKVLEASGHINLSERARMKYLVFQTNPLITLKLATDISITPQSYAIWRTCHKAIQEINHSVGDDGQCYFMERPFPNVYSQHKDM